MSCPLCGGGRLRWLGRDRLRPYYRCGGCALVFVPPGYHLGPEAERRHYDSHENPPGDPGYRRFLARLFEPLKARCPPPARGLDFGCGPGPALAAMGREAGYTMRVYDPFYADEAEALAGQYDFITATEVVEHLQLPGRVMAALLERLTTGGWLGVMTSPVPETGSFLDWHYIRDPTHIAFFSPATWDWFARYHDLDYERVGETAFLFRRRV